jgi:hypothetical protein
MCKGVNANYLNIIKDYTLGYIKIKCCYRGVPKFSPQRGGLNLTLHGNDENKN